jgi:hypothetical protein
MATTTTKEQLVEAISAAVAEIREHIDANNGDIDTPRDEIIGNIKGFSNELNRRYGAHIYITDNGIAFDVDTINIEFNPNAEFIRVGQGDFISTSVAGGGENSARINKYVEDCMYIAIFGSEDILPTLDIMS